MTDLRPSQAAKEGMVEARYIRVRSTATRKLAVPASINEKLRSFLCAVMNSAPSNQRELQEIKDQWEGGEAALSAKYFPMPNGADPNLWKLNKKLLTHVNLVGTVVRTWVNAVYADDGYRSAKGCDEAVSRWIESDEFAASMYRWAGYKVAFGNAVAVPRWDDVLEEIYTWLPDPVNTVVMVDKKDRRKIIGVAEVTNTRLDFISLWGEGTLYADDYDVEEWDELDWLPAIVSGPGAPMVRDAITATYSACTVLYNTRTMQKQQTTSILVRRDNLEKLAAVGAGRIRKGPDSGSIDLSPDGDAKFITPDPKIKESLEILRQIIIVLATASGIPADVLDPTLTESSSSAEGSRIRAIPFIQNSKPLLRAWRSDERNVVYAGEYLMRMVRGKTPEFKELRRSVVVDIGLSMAAIPQSPNEETQDLIAKVSFGLMTPEDAVRKLNYTKSKEQIIEMATALKDRLEQGAQELAQKALGGGRPPEQSGAGGSVKPAA